MIVKTFVPGDEGAEGGERHADACERAGDEERLALGPLDGLHQGRVVPAVDLAGSRNVDRIGFVLMDLGNGRTVRPVRDRGHGESGNLGEMGHFRTCGHVRAKYWKFDVPDELEQTALMVDQEHDGVLGVDHPLVNFGHRFPPCRIRILGSLVIANCLACHIVPPPGCCPIFLPYFSVTAG